MTAGTSSLSIAEWAYNSTPSGSIKFGQRDIPFDFIKARKAKNNAIVSIKRKEIKMQLGLFYHLSH